MSEHWKYTHIVMPFGSYKGEFVHELNINYLIWLSGLQDLREPLMSAVAEAIEMYGDAADYDDADIGHPGNPIYYGDN